MYSLYKCEYAWRKGMFTGTCKKMRMLKPSSCVTLHKALQNE